MNSKTDTKHGKFYAMAWEEIEAGKKDKATWAKAFALAEGVEEKAKATYISLRVATLGENQQPIENDSSNIKLAGDDNLNSKVIEKTHKNQKLVPVIIAIVYIFALVLLFFL
jgi:hypothetical protein